MKKNLKRNVLLAILAIVIILQFIPVNRINPPIDSAKDFMAVHNIDAQMAEAFMAACYDCHSNESNYPWYSYVAPASFWVVNHINEGRSELNFSEWTDYSAKKKDHKLEECIEALREGWMPLDSYVWLHANADLSADQREKMAVALEAVRAQIGYINTDE